MLMFRSTHDRKIKLMHLESTKLNLELISLTNQFNNVARQYNALVRTQNSQSKVQFSDQDLRRLIQLCHPDRHKNSELAVTMTQKLLGMKK